MGTEVITEGASTALAASNPWLAAGKLVIGALSSPSVKISQSGADSIGGIGSFLGENNIKKSKPLIEFDNPLHIALTAAGVVAAVYLYKKFKG